MPTVVVGARSIHGSHAIGVVKEAMIYANVTACDPGPKITPVVSDFSNAVIFCSKISFVPKQQRQSCGTSTQKVSRARCGSCYRGHRTVIFSLRFGEIRAEGFLQLPFAYGRPQRSRHLQANLKTSTTLIEEGKPLYTSLGCTHSRPSFRTKLRTKS